MTTEEYRKQYVNYDEVQAYFATLKDKCMYHAKYNGMLCQYGDKIEIFHDTKGNELKMCAKHADNLAENRVRARHY